MGQVAAFLTRAATPLDAVSTHAPMQPARQSTHAAPLQSSERSTECATLCAVTSAVTSGAEDVLSRKNSASCTKYKNSRWRQRSLVNEGWLLAQPGSPCELRFIYEFR